jgi:hypothetical protein
MRKGLLVGRIAAVLSALVLAGGYVSYKATGHVPLTVRSGLLTSQSADGATGRAGTEVSQKPSAAESPDSTLETRATESRSESLALSLPSQRSDDRGISPVLHSRTRVLESSVSPITALLPPQPSPVGLPTQVLTSGDATRAGAISPIVLGSGTTTSVGPFRGLDQSPTLGPVSTLIVVPGSKGSGLGDDRPGARVWNAGANARQSSWQAPTVLPPNGTPPSGPKRRTVILSGSKSAPIFDDHTTSQDQP